MKGVIATEDGYSGGATRNRTHEQACSHITGHAEVAKTEFERSGVSCAKLLDFFLRFMIPRRSTARELISGTTTARRLLRHP